MYTVYKQHILSLYRHQHHSSLHTNQKYSPHKSYRKYIRRRHIERKLIEFVWYFDLSGERDFVCCDWRGANVSHDDGRLSICSKYILRISHRTKFTLSHFRYETCGLMRKKPSSANVMTKIIMMMVVFFFFDETKANLAADRYQFVQLCSLFAIFNSYVFTLNRFHFSSSVSAFLTFALVCCHHRCRRRSLGVVVSHISFCNN